MSAAQSLGRTAGGSSPDERRFLAAIGDTVREARRERGLSRRALAACAGVSERYLAQLESGQGNASVLLLRRITDALALELASVLLHGPGTESARVLLGLLRGATGRQREAMVRAALAAAEPGTRPAAVALIGLRGAGKSTLGRHAAQALGLEFCELNDRISEASGLSVAEIFNLYGAEGYRRVERRCLEAVIDEARPLLLATGGGIVTGSATLELLLERFFSVWVRAEPEKHMARVRAQGDTRPMHGHAQAMQELRAILHARTPLYARADRQLDTSSKSVENCASALVRLLSEAGYGGDASAASAIA